MKVPTTQDEQAQFQTAIMLNSLLGTMLIKNLTPGHAVNLSKITRYTALEKTETFEVVDYIKADSLEKLTEEVNKFLAGDPNRSRQDAPVQSKDGAKTIWVQTVESSYTKSSGEFVPAIVLEGGEIVELTEEENEVFREAYRPYIQNSHEVFEFLNSLLPVEIAAETNEVEKNV